jgi:nucleoside-diphosphate-sugar epimerase
MVAWPTESSQVETGDFYFNIDKLAQALQWRPKVPLAEGIRRSLERMQIDSASYSQSE